MTERSSPDGFCIVLASYSLWRPFLCRWRRCWCDWKLSLTHVENNSAKLTQKIWLPNKNIVFRWYLHIQRLCCIYALQELVEQMAMGGGSTNLPAPAIPRLGIGPYQWNTECLHGIVHMPSTGFPQSIGLAASFRFSLHSCIVLLARWFLESEDVIKICWFHGCKFWIMSVIVQWKGLFWNAAGSGSCL